MLPPPAPSPLARAGGLGVEARGRGSGDTTIGAVVVAPVGFDVEGVTAAVGRGDVAAFEVLYRAWHERVFAMARGLTRRDESFCLDVAQEVMLRVAKGLPRIATEGELAGWMGRAVVSCAVDQMRREDRRARRERAVAEGASPAWERRGSQEWGSQEQLAWVWREIGRLPLMEQGLIMQRIGHGCTLKEAGLALGIGEQAAHGRVRRALEKLRRMAREVWP